MKCLLVNQIHDKHQGNMSMYHLFSALRYRLTEAGHFLSEEKHIKIVDKQMAQIL